MSDNDSVKPEEGEKTRLEENDVENPDWDGSEAEFISDDDTEEYEIPETGFRISYVLTKDEIYSCLYHSGAVKTKGARAIIQSIILAVAAVIFFVVYFTTKSQYNNYNIFFGVLCLITIAAIWIVPRIYLRSMSKMMTDGKTIEAEIYPTHIDIGSGGEGEWSIPLDGSSYIEEADGIIMILAEKNRIFAIPKRVIEPEVYNEISAILRSGTEPADF